MKPDEVTLLLAVAAKSAEASVRDVVQASGIHHKRCLYLLQKWCGKGWYSYGVSLDLGWLTEKGKEAAAKAKEELR
jgi:hypothetical protein